MLLATNPGVEAVTKEHQVTVELAALARRWKESETATTSVIPLVLAVAKIHPQYITTQDQEQVIEQQCCADLLRILMQCAAASLAYLASPEVKTMHRETYTLSS